GTLRSDSVLVGNVYLVGHGDCLLTPNDIELLAEQLRRNGIRSIQGDVVGDASFFDALTERQAYSGDAERMQDMPPISALGINKNLVTVLVSSNSSGGTHVQTIPQSSALRVIGDNTNGGVGNGTVGGSVGGNTADAAKIQARSQSQAQLQSLMQSAPKPAARTQKIQHEAPREATHEARRAASSVRAKRSKLQPQRRVSAKKHRRQTRTSHSRKHRRRAALAPEILRFERIPQFPAYGSGEAFGDMRLPVLRTKRSRAPRRARVSVSSSMAANGVQVFSVRGSVPRNTTRAFTYEIGRPALATAGVLVRSLQAEGIRVAGNVREGRAPAGARTLAEVRRPLTELLHPVNKNSDNFVAEHVMKIVGAHCCGNTMCSVNAFKTVTSILDTASIPHSGCVLYDGSGLSRRNKTSASTQMYMLKSIAEQPFAATFINTMGIAGVDGTIRRRMLGTNAVGNVHAKTGTHSSVSALSGYVRSKDGERFCFSFIGNGLPAGVLKQMENACVIQLAEFSHREGTVSLAKPRRR
ncbi:MAG: D-alanyl-D-alanine carboxypeptidase precursor, partial [Bacteroidota bacterium]